mgnify:CR=1 FL=1
MGQAPGGVPVIAISIAVGGAVGAPLRWIIDEYVTRRLSRRFPWGTLAVNLLGSLILGTLAGLAAHRNLGTVATAILEPGLCGALTTFSTFAYQTVEFLESRQGTRAAGNVLANLALGLTVAIAGFALADAATG